MKNTISIAFLLLCIGTFSACTKSNSTTSNDPVYPANIVGAWRISQITDNSNGDITPQYSAYTFNFNAGGSAAVFVNSVSTAGTWLVRNSDDNGGSQKMEIQIGTSVQLARINKKWQIVSANGTTISLKDDNAASNERLVFTKN